MKYILLILSFLVISCYQTPTIEGFDPQKWENSIIQCDEYRTIAVDILLDKQEELKGLNQNEWTNLLGTALKNELYDRNQKFLFYSLDCDNKQQLKIRFDALGRASEITKIRVSD